MSVPAARAERLLDRLLARGLDALLVTTLVDVRYLTGFTGTAGGALLRADGSGLFLTDFRYQEQSAAQVGAPWEIAVVDDLPRALAETLGAAGRLGVDETSLTLRAARKLRESLGDAWELAGGENEVAKLREVKEAGEVDALRAAARLADEALAEVVAGGLAGRSELEVAFELELAMRRLGAQALSFPPIVASGPRGALPHAQPTDERIEPDVLVTIDWGAELDGYCSDCTRTFATGESLPDWAREIYDVTLRAQETGLAAIATGTTGREVDAAARAVIEQAGYGDRFGHGLGHGVGLEVHEGPTLSRRGSEEPLAAGNVVTDEPGIYLPGRGGVRIEDLVVVGEDANEILTGLTKDLQVIA